MEAIFSAAKIRYWTTPFRLNFSLKMTDPRKFDKQLFIADQR